MEDRTIAQLIMDEFAQYRKTGSLKEIQVIERNNLPNWENFPNGCSVDINESTLDRIVVNTIFKFGKHTNQYKVSFTICSGCNKISVQVTPCFNEKDNRYIDIISEAFRDRLSEFIG